MTLPRAHCPRQPAPRQGCGARGTALEAGRRRARRPCMVAGALTCTAPAAIRRAVFLSLVCIPQISQLCSEPTCPWTRLLATPHPSGGPCLLSRAPHSPRHVHPASAALGTPCPHPQLWQQGLRGLGRHPSVPGAQSWSPSLGGPGGCGCRGHVQSCSAPWNPCWGLEAAALPGFVTENQGQSHTVWGRGRRWGLLSQWVERTGDERPRGRPPGWSGGSPLARPSVRRGHASPPALPALSLCFSGRWRHPGSSSTCRGTGSHSLPQALGGPRPQPPLPHPCLQAQPVSRPEGPTCSSLGPSGPSSPLPGLLGALERPAFGRTLFRDLSSPHL